MAVSVTRTGIAVATGSVDAEDQFGFSKGCVPQKIKTFYIAELQNTNKKISNFSLSPSHLHLCVWVCVYIVENAQLIAHKEISRSHSLHTLDDTLTAQCSVLQASCNPMTTTQLEC